MKMREIKTAISGALVITLLPAGAAFGVPPIIAVPEIPSAAAPLLIAGVVAAVLVMRARSGKDDSKSDE